MIKSSRGDYSNRHSHLSGPSTRVNCYLSVSYRIFIRFLLSTGPSRPAHFFVVSPLPIVVRLLCLVSAFPRLIPCPVAAATTSASVASTSSFYFPCPCRCPTTATPSSATATTPRATLSTSATSCRVWCSTSAVRARRHRPRVRPVSRKLVLLQHLIFCLWLGKRCE